MNAFDVRVKCDTPRDLGIGICEMSGYLNDFSDDETTMMSENAGD